MAFGTEELAAYCQRIGWDGAVAPDRATLEAFALRQPAAIPFENLDPFLGRPVDLSPDALVAKLIHGRRGGYCFEQNGLLRLALEAVGFSVVPLSARVLWNQPPGTAVSPRTHMLLLVELAEGPVLIDVGLGGAVLTGVLDLVPDIEQPTPHEPFRLLREGKDWIVQIRIAGEWRPTCRFDLTPQHQIDYELANWWTSASPRSHFTQGLTIARTLPDRRLALRNREFAIHSASGTERRTLPDAEAVCTLLETEFGLDLPDRAGLAERIAGLN